MWIDAWASIAPRHGECRRSLALSAATAIVSHLSIGEVAKWSAVANAQSWVARPDLIWIAIPPPIARKHVRSIGEFLVSLILAILETHSLSI